MRSATLKSARKTPNFSSELIFIESLRLFFLPNAVGPPFCKHQSKFKFYSITKLSKNLHIFEKKLKKLHIFAK